VTQQATKERTESPDNKERITLDDAAYLDSDELNDKLTRIQSPDNKPSTLQETEGEITHYHVADNSIGFRQWLSDNNVDFIPNGHFTSIPLKGNDIFRLGERFALYKQQAQHKAVPPAPQTK
jgi:hypothetical protein